MEILLILLTIYNDQIHDCLGRWLQLLYVHIGRKNPRLSWFLPQVKPVNIKSIHDDNFNLQWLNLIK